jgi:hypothetical protein
MSPTLINNGLNVGDIAALRPISAIAQCAATTARIRRCHTLAILPPHTGRTLG